MYQIIEKQLLAPSVKKHIEAMKQHIHNAITRRKELFDELSEALKRDDLSFIPLLSQPLLPEAYVHCTVMNIGDSPEPQPPYEAPPLLLGQLPMAKVRTPRKRGKPLKALFRDATLSSRWEDLCREFFAPCQHEEIDGCMSNRVLQRFAWFLSEWQEDDLLIGQIFSPAVRFLQSLGFRLVIDFHTCNNVLRRIFARREEFQDAKNEVLAFCKAHA